MAQVLLLTPVRKLRDKLGDKMGDKLGDKDKNWMRSGAVLMAVAHGASVDYSRQPSEMGVLQLWATATATAMVCSLNHAECGQNVP
jgi:hypothetical protein